MEHGLGRAAAGAGPGGSHFEASQCRATTPERSTKLLIRPSTWAGRRQPPSPRRTCRKKGPHQASGISSHDRTKTTNANPASQYPDQPDPDSQRHILPRCARCGIPRPGTAHPSGRRRSHLPGNAPITVKREVNIGERRRSHRTRRAGSTRPARLSGVWGAARTRVRRRVDRSRLAVPQPRHG